MLRRYFLYIRVYTNFKAKEQADSFDKCPITVEWAPVALGTAEIVPDAHRNPHEQMTPAALLASLGDDEVFVKNKNTVNSSKTVPLFVALLFGEMPGERQRSYSSSHLLFTNRSLPKRQSDPLGIVS